MDYVFGVFCFPSGIIFPSEEVKSMKFAVNFRNSFPLLLSLGWLVGLLALHERGIFFCADAGTPYFFEEL